MRLRTITYASLIVAGFFAGLFFPFIEMIGVGASVVLSALFLPYLGWKNILKINMVLSCFAVLITIPYLTSSYSETQQIIDVANSKIKDNITKTNTTSLLVPEGLSVLIPLAPFIGYGNKVFWIYTVNKIIKKRGIYKIFSF